MSGDNLKLKMLVHDIRNQLVIVSATNEMATTFLKNNNSEKALEILAKMKNSISKLTSIVDDALQNSATSLELKTELKVLKMDMECNYDLDITISGDDEFKLECKKTDIVRMFDNVCKNASEADAKNILAHITKQGILFSDDGKGMPADVLKKLNAGTSTTTKETGHGLGTQQLRDFCNNNSLDLKFAKKRKNVLDETKSHGTHIIMKRV